MFVTAQEVYDVMQELRKTQQQTVPTEQTQQEENQKDMILYFAAERSVDMVKAYCAIENVPEVLKGVCVSIGLLLYDTENYEQRQQQGSLKSMRQGNVTVTYEQVQERFEKDKKKILEGFSEELNQFRVMKW